MNCFLAFERELHWVNRPTSEVKGCSGGLGDLNPGGIKYVISINQLIFARDLHTKCPSWNNSTFFFFMNDVMSGNHSNQTNVTRLRKKKSSSYLFGWYFFSGFYNFFSRCKLKRSPLLLISVCEDDPNYADMCPKKAAIKDYCVHQKEFMEKECPKSCGFCSSSKSQVVNKFTQIPFLFYNIWLY